MVFAAAGCGVSPLSDDWIPRRPLAQDYPAYQAPANLPDDAKKQPAEPAPPEVAGELTLRRALELALLHNPDLKPLAWQRHAAGARKLQASLPPNPTVGFMVEQFGGTAPLNRFEGAETSIRLSQLIETADKRGRRIALAEADRQLVLWDYEAKRVQVATDAAQRFIEVLAGQERVRLAEESLSLAEQTHRLVDDRVRTGVAPVLDRDKAAVRLSTEKIALERTRRQLQTARAKLAAMWGREATFARAVGTLEGVPEIPTLAALNSKLAQNPQVARYEAELEQRRAAIDLARAKAAPDVTAGGGVMYMSDSNNTVFLLELMVPLPLFDRNQGGILESRFNLASAKAQQQAALVNAGTMLAQAYHELSAAHYEAATLRDETLPAAKRAFDAVKQAYESGKATYLDVLDAQRTLVESQREQVNARAMVHGTLAAVEGLVGEPLSNQDR